MMKLWIDDIRRAPVGYVWLRSVNETKKFIENYELLQKDPILHYRTEISLIDIDHDAGDYAEDGGDYIKLLDWLEETGRCYPIRIHSMNPVVVGNMRRVITKNGWKEISSPLPATNADRIRAMSDEQLAALLCDTGWKMAERAECLEWLRSTGWNGDIPLQLQDGMDIWYVDFDNKCLEHGKAAYLEYKDGELDSFGVEFDDDDFDEFDAKTFGAEFFLTEDEAHAALLQGDPQRNRT